MTLTHEQVNALLKELAKKTFEIEGDCRMAGDRCIEWHDMVVTLALTELPEANNAQ
jgi:hypothetical protein